MTDQFFVAIFAAVATKSGSTVLSAIILYISLNTAKYGHDNTPFIYESVMERITSMESPDLEERPFPRRRGMKNWERRRGRKSEGWEGDIDDTYTFPGILCGR